MGEGLRWQAPGWDVFLGDKVCSEPDFGSLPLASEWVWREARGTLRGCCAAPRKVGGAGDGGGD